MVEASAKGGRVMFDGKIVTIDRQSATGSGFGSFIQQGIQGNRSIVAKYITAVEFREPTKGKAGFIAFDFPGKNPPRGGVFDAAADENAMIFGLDNLPEFAALHKELVAYLSDL